MERKLTAMQVHGGQFHRKPLHHPGVMKYNNLQADRQRSWAARYGEFQIEIVGVGFSSCGALIAC